MSKRKICPKCKEYRQQVISIAAEITQIKNQDPITIASLQRKIGALNRQIAGVMAVNRSVNKQLDLANCKVSRAENLKAGGNGNLNL